MSLVIVPNELRYKIYNLIDEQTKLVPQSALDREIFYKQLLKFYNEFGYIPEFELVKKSNYSN